MENIIAKMLLLADELDKQGLSEEVKILDACISSAGLIKTAQYVGIQGYWVKQERAFVNCYNTKRRQSKGKSTPHECVMGCLDEYQESVNTSVETDKWSRYAQIGTTPGQADSIQGKNTGTVGGNVAGGKEIIQKLDKLQEKRKANNGKIKIAELIDFFDSAKQAEAEEYIEKLSNELSDNLIKVADSLDKKGLNDKVGEVDKMIKEAQWWRNFMRGMGTAWNWLKGLFPGQGGQVITNRLNVIFKDLNEYFGTLRGQEGYLVDDKIKSSVDNAYNASMQFANKFKEQIMLLPKAMQFDKTGTPNLLTPRDKPQPPPQGKDQATNKGKSPSGIVTPTEQEVKEYGKQQSTDTLNVKTAQIRRNPQEIYNDMLKQLQQAMREIGQAGTKAQANTKPILDQLNMSLRGMMQQVSLGYNAVFQQAQPEQPAAAADTGKAKEQAAGQKTGLPPGLTLAAPNLEESIRQYVGNDLSKIKNIADMLSRISQELNPR